MTKTGIGPRYPWVVVPLTGEDGNAFFIIGRATRLAREAGVPREERERFQKEAMAGNYDNVLQTVMRWFATE